ncbi:MAG: hypothetical protein CML19_00150 [Pusillimonas sp.]|nr:hypothetical protein [Pusillimonas sp.]|tara:strand:+ start:73 stop:480 length:408 start_codon:yes stop_codon:yes gene_type:complete
MADAVTATTVIDGPKSAIIYCTNTSDGTGESAVTKVDVSALSSLQDGTACSGVRIQKIVFTNVGMGVKVLWNASTNVIAAQLPADYSDTLDYSDLSGLPNVAASGGKTGDIKFTTVGHSSGDTYSIVLYCLKQYS